MQNQRIEQVFCNFPQRITPCFPFHSSLTMQSTSCTTDNTSNGGSVASGMRRHSIGTFGMRDRMRCGSVSDEVCFKYQFSPN